MAAIAGARAVAKSTVISPVGETVRAIVSIDRLVVGPISADNVLPSVVPAGSFDAEGKIHGLIGQDVLAWLRYTLDFKRRVVEWHDKRRRAAASRSNSRIEHGRFLVSLPQDHTTLRLVPDSGAGGLVLFNAAGRASHNIVDTGETVAAGDGACQPPGAPRASPRVPVRRSDDARRAGRDD